MDPLSYGLSKKKNNFFVILAGHGRSLIIKIKEQTGEI